MRHLILTLTLLIYAEKADLAEANINDCVYGMPIERPTSHPLQRFRDQVDGEGGKQLT